MAKKKSKKRNTGKQAGGNRQDSGLVRLSQCMIVKNEERNIEKALSWGKGIVCEQIVVDTGSTDRTIEIAERMGAKVLHFEWVGDFAAAKNFALEQAKGNWIAFLDADEYFPKEEAKKILPILGQVMTDPSMRGKYAIACSMHQLDDNGKVMEVNMQARLFRNVPEVRYTGRIHEQLSVGAPEIIRTENLCIMHTGYSESANADMVKSERNISMLRRELEMEPDSLRMKMYLADALVSYANGLLIGKGKDTVSDRGETAEVRVYADEAEALYKEVALGDTSELDPEYKKTAYRYLLRKYGRTPGEDPEYDDICRRAQREYPDDVKIMCYYASVLNKKGEYRKAFDVLRQCEAGSESRGKSGPSISVPDLLLMCKEFVSAAHGLGDAESIMKYTIIILSIEKDNINILSIYIKLLLRQVQTDENVLEIISMTYNLKDKEEAAIVAAAARQCGADSLAEKLGH